MNTSLARFFLLVASVSLCATPAFADATSTPRVISASGNDLVRIPATLARMTVMVETQDQTAVAAQNAAAEHSRSVLAFLERSRVDRLQAGALALNPIYSSNPPRPSSHGDEPPEIVAYRAQWTASFEIEAARAGEISGGVVDAGASRIVGFDFTATREALAQAQQEALRGAALRARERATAVLDALGYRAGDVVKVDIHQGGPIQPFSQRAETMMALSATSPAATAVEPGLIDVNGSVSLEVSY